VGWAGAGGYYAGLVGEDDGLDAAAQVELGQQAADVALDRRFLEPERRAISALLIPLAMRTRTSRSRALSVSSRRLRSAVGEMAAKRAIRRRVTSGR
jgi:hypothetical protein